MKRMSTLIISVLICVLFAWSAVSADENAALYLKTYYDVEFSGEVSAEAFNEALAALGAEPVTAETLTLADAAAAAVRLANMEELAKPYAGGSDPYIACAGDLGLLDGDIDPSSVLSAETAASLLYRAAEFSGKGRRYIGRLSDPEILSQVWEAINSIILFDDETLNEAGINILVSDAATGYSLKAANREAQFIEENTLRYGHSSALHLLQLVGLMKREGFDAYLQVEPKVSVYEYLPEWGEPAPRSLTYSVQEMTEGRFFAFSLEYELVFEFDGTADKERFHDLIETYAKKYDDRVDADGNVTANLLADSWWQPLYYSTTGMENPEFAAIIDHRISNAEGTYVIHTFGLPEASAGIAEAVKAIDPELSVEEADVYVNPAFYRYVTDADYQ